MTHHLDHYPSSANPLPVAWDGKEVEWDEWAEAATFTCARTLKKSRTACDRCQADPKMTLVLHGHVGEEELLLTLLRCPNCGADTVVDWDNDVWDLDESDYGPDGSWDTAPPTLFSPTTERLPTCSICGREGDVSMSADAQGTYRCADDELCARRARSNRKDS